VPYDRTHIRQCSSSKKVAHIPQTSKYITKGKNSLYWIATIEHNFKENLVENLDISKVKMERIASRFKIGKVIL
jgi:hypothetical protein